MKKITFVISAILCCLIIQTIATTREANPGVKQLVTPPVKTNFLKRFGTNKHLGVGIEIHFISGHEKDLDMIAAAGFKFVRIDFTWDTIERIKGVYSWGQYDELMANLKKRGLQAIGILDYSNPFYEGGNFVYKLTGREQQGVISPQHPESIAAFAHWAATAAAHFKSYNIIWEIWNEPDGDFWKPNPDAAQYTALALATCKAMRATVPDAAIIGPATSRVPMPYMEIFMSSGILRYLDAVSIHPYREYSNSPETAIIDYKNLRGLIEKYAPADKKQMPVISSEWGYSNSTKGVSEGVQAAYMVRMQLANRLYGIPISIWYDWINDGPDPVEHEQNFGTVKTDYTPKAAYISLKIMNMQLNGFAFIRRIAVNNDNDYVLLFKNDKSEYKLAVWTIGDKHSLVLNSKLSKTAYAATAINGNGSRLKLKTEQGKLLLDMGMLPQYISLAKGITLN